MGMHEVSSLLWAERELLDVLLFKLEEQQLLLTAGKTRWLPKATAEIERVQHRLREVALALAVEASGVAEEWNLPADATLAQLIEGAPDDAGIWKEILEAHHLALTSMFAELQQFTDSNEQLLRASVRATQETLADVTTAPSTYNARGVTDTVRASARLIDKEL